MKIYTILLLLLLVCAVKATEQSRKRRVRHRGSVRHSNTLTESSTGDGFGLKTNGINESPNESTSVNGQVQSSTNVSQWDNTYSTGVNISPGDGTFITGVNSSPGDNTFITGVGSSPAGDNTFITSLSSSPNDNTFITGVNSSPSDNTYITGGNSSPGDNTFANGVNNSPSDSTFLIRVTEPENENTGTTGINEPQTENTYLTGVTQPQAENNSANDLESAGTFHFDLKTSLSGHDSHPHPGNGHDGHHHSEHGHDSHHHPGHVHDSHHHAFQAPHSNLKYYGGSSYHATPLEKLQLEYGKEKIQSITVTKEVPVVIHKPYPVTVEKKVPFPVKVPYPVPVHVYNPVPVPVQKDVPYVVEKPVPYPVKVPYEKPVPYPIKVPVEKPVPYPVRVPVAVTKIKKVPVPYPVYVEKKVPVYIPQKGKLGSSQGSSLNSHSSPLVFKGSSFSSGGLGLNSYKGLSFSGLTSGSSTGGSTHGSNAIGLESGTSVRTYSGSPGSSFGSFGSGSLTYGTGGKGLKGSKGSSGGGFGSIQKGSRTKSTPGLKATSSNIKYSVDGTSFKKGHSYAVVENSGAGSSGSGLHDSGYATSFPHSGSSADLGSSSDELKTHVGGSSVSIHGKPIPTFGASSSGGASDALTSVHNSLSYGSGSEIQTGGGIESSYVPGIHGFSGHSPSTGSHSGSNFHYGNLGLQQSSNSGVESGLLFTHQSPSSHNLFGGTTSVDQPSVHNQYYGQSQVDNGYGGQSQYLSSFGGDFKGNLGDQQIIYGHPAVGSGADAGNFDGHSFSGHSFTGSGSLNDHNSYAGQYSYEGSSQSPTFGSPHVSFNNDGGISVSTSISVAGSDALGLGSNIHENVRHSAFSSEPARFSNEDPRFQNDGPRFPNEDTRFPNESPKFPNGDPRFPNAMSRFTNEDARAGPEQSSYGMYHYNSYDYPPHREYEQRERKSFRDYMLK